jgi:two-component system, NtrC family, sensor kinase
MEWIFKSMKTAEEANCTSCLENSWFQLGNIYSSLGDEANALLYFQKVLDANKRNGSSSSSSLLNAIGERHRLMGNYPEAIKSYQEAIAVNKDPYNIELNESNLADVYVRMDTLPLAFQYAFSSLKSAEKLKDVIGVTWIDGILARAYLKKNMADSALYYAKNGLNIATKNESLEFMRDNSEALAKAYVQKNDYKNAYKYNNLFVSYKDSMTGAEVTNKTNLLQFEFKKQKTEAQIALLNQQKESQRYFLIGALILVFLIMIAAIVLFRNNRHKQKANVLLTKQKQEIQDQRDQTKKAMAELQDTQKQLIQSEKMASLGELTAGIAHEIQNPLNFVNNFSEVNKELIDELQNELKEGNVDEAVLISNDIKENEQKINHHGKRADAIVKGMLQHSRKSSGEKEPTDINALADEYLRLSYHGLRAKDKSFNADFKTHFDETIGKINVVPQEIGRVLLNLYNNAFYAISEKQNTEMANGNRTYKPTVIVSTQKSDGHIEIKVSDNGNGIPQKVLDKIYQPFFTTKPTGQGTGLGLSLSYDIIKVHHGQIKVETTEGQGTQFSIVLPATIPVNQLTL